MSQMDNLMKLAAEDFKSAAPALYVLMAAMCLDTVMGLLIAFTTRTVSSSASWRGVSKKAGVLIIIAFASVVDPFVPTVPLALFVCLFYIVPEGLSIFENAAKLGIPIPKIMKEALLKIGESADEKNIQPVRIAGQTNTVLNVRQVKDEEEAR